MKLISPDSRVKFFTVGPVISPDHNPLKTKFQIIYPSAAAKFSWNSALFSPNEFHPYVTSVPVFSVSFDDFLKGGI